MAVTTTFVNGNTADADEVNTNFTDVGNDSTSKSFLNIVGAESVEGVLAMATVSASIFVAATGNATNVRRSTDAGKTFSNIAHNLGAACTGIIACVADATNLIAWTDAGATSYSADSGATFVADATPPPNVSNFYGVSFPTTTLAVAVGNAASGVAQWITTDPTTNLAWAQASAGTTANSHAVHMLDGTSGFFIDASGNIWKTDPDADNWSDTGHQTHSGSAITDQILAVTSTTAIIGCSLNQLGIGYYDGTQNSYSVCRLKGASDSDVSNFQKSTAGNYYSVGFEPTGGVEGTTCVLYKSTDGITWTARCLLPIRKGSGTAGAYVGPTLQEYDTNKLLFWNNGSNEIFIDESY